MAICERAAREREVKQAIKTVATYLGNRPAVCRASYVDPRVIDRFQAHDWLREAFNGMLSSIETADT
jgi:DNA topoisomerase-1